MLTSSIRLDAGSFRDPSGFVFYNHGEIYRQVNLSYQANYDQLIQSGLYHALVDSGLMIPHEESEFLPPQPDRAYKVIKPAPIPFISYPYEWCFSQLQEAARTTLKIQKLALDVGMSLKDCSAFNIQFQQAGAIFIDSLSFERYEPGTPWVAYKQFCQHFLAPLALMSYKDLRLNQLGQIYLDGIPLDLAKSLLSIHNYLHWSIFFHICLHVRSQKHYGYRGRAVASTARFSQRSFQGLIESLHRAVDGLTVRERRSEWSDYKEGENHHPSETIETKKKTVSAFLDKCDAKTLWDVGANTGLYSRMAGDKGIRVIALDQDPLCVELNYREAVKNHLDILPLVMDLAAPSPGIGWQLQERRSLFQRSGTDTVLALGVIHHLAVGGNLPLKSLAEFFARMGERLIIEFIAKEDPKVQWLLSTRKDIFFDYTKENFEDAFGNYFVLEAAQPLRSSHRTVYLMRRRAQSH